MLYRRLSLILVLLVAIASAAFAAGDPLKSLFLFQKQMAETGVTSAMMKLGEMYEHGEGVEQSNANALLMYQKAYYAGYEKAEPEIKRLQKLNIKSSNKSKKKNKSSDNKRATKKRQQEQQRNVATREQAKAVAKQKANKAARNKALQERLAKDKLVRARAAQAAKAAKVKAAKARAARIRAAKLKAQRIARAKAQKAAKLKAAQTTAESDVQPEIIEIVEDEETQNTDEQGFKSDPCKSKAARLLSICRK